MIIGICDDKCKDVMNISQMIKNVAVEQGWEFQLRYFTNVIEETMSELAKTDILFLDIEMPQISGIEIKELFQVSAETFIIFVSSHSERMEESFGKNVIGFLVKPVSQDKLNFFLRKAVFLANRGCKVFALEGKSVKSTEISYIQSDHVYTNLFLTSGRRIYLRKNIGSWENELKNCDFVRIHKSYLINLEQIEYIEGKSVKIKNYGEKVSTSREGQKLLVAEYKKICRRMVRY